MNETPFEVLDDFPETGDLSGQQGGETIDAYRKVRFAIQSVEPKVVEKDGTKLMAKLNVRVAIASGGVDGDGKYKGKNLFIELLTWANPDVYTSEWWTKNARFPYKSFLKALGYDPANPPKVNDTFLSSLKKREFIGDITKKAVTEATGEVTSAGKKVYKPTGEFKNEVTNFKSAE